MRDLVRGSNGLILMSACTLDKLAKLNLGDFGRLTACIKHHDATDGAATLFISTLLTSCRLVLLHCLLFGQPGITSDRCGVKEESEISKNW